MFCALQYGTDFGTCRGDSGGPMVQDDGVIVTLIGVVHGAISSCDGSRYPSIFTRVNNPLILNWIYTTVGFLDTGKTFFIKLDWSPFFKFTYQIPDNCDCLPFKSCDWSKEAIDGINDENDIVKKAELSSFFKKRICNKEKRHVYCCGQNQTPPNEKMLLEEESLLPNKSRQ